MIVMKTAVRTSHNGALRSSVTAVVGHRNCGNQWALWRRSGGDRRIRRTGTWEGVLCERWDSRRGSVRPVLTLQGTERRVNERETEADSNDWISWSNNYSGLAASNRRNTLAGCSKSSTSYPPNPGAPRRAVPRARPQASRDRRRYRPHFVGPFARTMDLGRTEKALQQSEPPELISMVR